MPIYDLAAISKKTGKTEVETAKLLIGAIYTKARAEGKDQKVILNLSLKKR